MWVSFRFVSTRLRTSNSPLGFRLFRDAMEQPQIHIDLNTPGPEIWRRPREFNIGPKILSSG